MHVQATRNRGDSQGLAEATVLPARAAGGIGRGGLRGDFSHSLQLSQHQQYTARINIRMAVFNTDSNDAALMYG